MEKENKFWVKILVLPILCFLLGKLDIGNVSNIRDFMTGFIMAVLIIILWQVYSLIRSLQEMQSKKEENEDSNIKQ